MRHRILTLLLPLALLGPAGPACANEAPEEPDAEKETTGWSGTGELGVVLTSGNTESRTISGKLALSYEAGAWEHAVGFTTLFASQNGEQTAERYEITGKSRYSVSERSYWFGTLRYADDRFSGYEYQLVVTAGYGRTFLDTETQHLNVEVGAGVRRIKPRFEPNATSGPVVRAAAVYQWQITDDMHLENDFLVETGSDNTYLENNLSLHIGINSHLALKLGYSVRHNTDVPPTVENTDTVTTVNLVYSFE